MASPKRIKLQQQWNDVFATANKSLCRYRVLKGSAGSGKSVNVAQDYLIRLMCPHFKGANLLVVRKVEESNRDSTFAELESALNRMIPGHVYDFWDIRRQPMSLTCKATGNSIIFRGMYDERQREKVKSITFKQGKLTWIWIEEATELTSEDVDTLDDRLRGQMDNSNLYYQITMTFNPVSVAHWIKGRFFDIQHPDIFTHHSTYRDNRFIDEAYARRMEFMRQTDPERYKVYGLGEWGETGGLILTNFIAEEFNIDSKFFDSMVIGQDFGFNHANCLLLVGFKDGEIYVCRELYLHDLDTNEIIERAKQAGWDSYRGLRMLCDAAEPDRIVMWRRANYSAMPCIKGPGSVNAQIDYLRGRKIHIHAVNCPNTLKEIQTWKWKKDTKTSEWTDTPMDVFDDAMAALRYSISDRVRGAGASVWIP